jgi:mannose/cellobiose epimerase-like protein (N-acyl-D-glucosamine 2-epimerase family)
VLTAGDFDGTLDAAWDPDGNGAAKSYEVQTSADPLSATSWSYKMSATKSSTTLEGLTSGAKQWVRVRGLGAAGPGPWSDPATKTVP